MTTNSDHDFLRQLLEKRIKWVEANRENDFEEGIYRLLSDIYSTQAHFIYELLQNAEDAQASKIHFELGNECLRVIHNGKRIFQQDNVDSITSIGKSTKRDDINQIGEFGIGFKSVFSYTAAPRILSRDFNFEIKDLVCPYPINPIQMDSSETIFEFPFNNDKKKPENAFAEIEEWLNSLSDTALLFLNNIQKITWCIIGHDQGSIERVVNINHTATIRKSSSNSGVTTSHWLRFQEPVKLQLPDSTALKPNSQLHVAIAYKLLVTKTDGSFSKIEPVSGQLCIFFPAEKETTRLKFHIHAPFAATVARDAISDCLGNQKLIVQIAELVASSLHSIKEMNLLTTDVFKDIIPIRPNDFKDSQFQAFFDLVKKELGEQSLLPTDEGGFVSARHAKLARGADLRNLLRGGHLQSLFGSNMPISWLSEDITESEHDLWGYLKNELGIAIVDGDKFASLLTEAFLREQTDEWVAEFYGFLLSQESLWKNSDSILRKKPILRLEDNTHVNPFHDGGQPNAYLPGPSSTKFPSIKRNIVNEPKAKEFLQKLGVLEPYSFSEAFAYILPKYKPGSEIKVNFNENREDLNQILLAGKSIMKLITCELYNLLLILDDPSKKSLIQPAQLKCKDLIEQFRIQMIQFGCKEVGEECKSSNDSDYFYKLFYLIPGSFPIFYTINDLTKAFAYKTANQLYISSHELKVYFSGNPNVWFLDSRYSDEIKSFCLSSGTEEQQEHRKCPRLICPDNRVENGYRIICNIHGNRKHGLDGFDPDCDIDGLEHALNHITKEKAIYIWNELAIPNKKLIRGVIESSSRQDFLYSQKEEKLSKMGRLLVEKEWLPDKAGQFHRPSELKPDDLPDEFNRDEQLAKQLEMKADESAIFVKYKPVILAQEGIDEDDIEFIKELKSLPPEESAKIKNQINQIKKRIEIRSKSIGGTSHEEENTGDGEHGASFIRLNYSEEFTKNFSRPLLSSKAESAEPQGPVINPDRYRNKTQEGIQNDIKNEPPPENRFQPISRNIWEKKCVETRKFLEEQYHGMCQICGSTFQKRDGKPYFEGCYIVHRIQARWIDRQGNVLCLCPTCCAKFKYGSLEANNIKEQIEALRMEKEGGNGTLQVSIHLCGEKHFIRFSERHLSDLQELLKSGE